MTPETTKHLAQVEAAIQKAKQLLARQGYNANLRNLMVIAFIDQMLEHHESMLLLIRNGKVGSAFSLGRSIFDSMFRGLWIALCATDAQIADFEKKDELPLGMKAMALAIDAATSDPADPHNFFSDLKARGWSALCSYAHSGLLQLGRRFTGQDMQPCYSDGEIVEVTTSTTTCVLLLIGRFFVMQNRREDAQAAEGLIETYGEVARQAAQQQSAPPDNRPE